MKTQTPETDSLIFEICNPSITKSEAYKKMLKLGRKLERERDSYIQAHSSISGALAANEELIDTYDDIVTKAQKHIEKLNQQLDEISKVGCEAILDRQQLREKYKSKCILADKLANSIKMYLSDKSSDRSNLEQSIKFWKESIND